MKNKITVFIILVSFVIYGCAEKREEEIRSIQEYSRQLAIDGRYRDATTYLEENIKQKEKDANYYLYHGLYLELEDPLYNLQKYNTDYLEAYELDPENYDIAVRLGQSYNLLNDWEKAIIYLEKAVELYPQAPRADSNPYDSLSLAYYSFDEFEKSFTAIEKAIDISPEDAWNYLDKGLILSHLEGLNPLTEYYEIAVSMDPDNIEFPKYYGNRLIEMGLDDLAIEHFNKFIAIDENFYWASADLGYIKMAQGDLNGGKALLDKSMAIIDNDPLTLKYLAFYYHFRGLVSDSYDYYVDYRLSMEKNVPIYRPKTIKEFTDYFSDDVLFQRLQKVYVNES